VRDLSNIEKDFSRNIKTVFEWVVGVPVEPLRGGRRAEEINDRQNKYKKI
jgi:hypothetical protein